MRSDHFDHLVLHCSTKFITHHHHTHYHAPNPQIIRLFGIQLRILSEFQPWTFECAVCMPRIQIMLWPQPFWLLHTQYSSVWRSENQEYVGSDPKKKKKKKGKKISPSFSFVPCSFCSLNSQHLSHLSPHIICNTFHTFDHETGEMEYHQTVLCYRQVQKHPFNSISQLYSCSSYSAPECATSAVYIHLFVWTMCPS